jgi:hypothetical protein
MPFVKLMKLFPNRMEAIDGLDVLDPDFEDDHDAALSVANVAASEARQDAANPQ